MTLSQSTKHFVRHYLEMVAAMFARDGRPQPRRPSRAMGAFGTSWGDISPS